MVLSVPKFLKSSPSGKLCTAMVRSPSPASAVAGAAAPRVVVGDDQEVALRKQLFEELAVREQSLTDDDRVAAGPKIDVEFCTSGLR